MKPERLHVEFLDPRHSSNVGDPFEHIEAQHVKCRDLIIHLRDKTVDDISEVKVVSRFLDKIIPSKLYYNNGTN